MGKEEDNYSFHHEPSGSLQSRGITDCSFPLLLLSISCSSYTAASLLEKANALRATVVVKGMETRSSSSAVF